MRAVFVNDDAKQILLENIRVRKEKMEKMEEEKEQLMRELEEKMEKTKEEKERLMRELANEEESLRKIREWGNDVRSAAAEAFEK